MVTRPASRGLRAIDAGGGVRLRRFRKSDAPALARLANDSRIAANLRDAFPHPYSIDDARGFLAMIVGAEQPIVFAIEAGGRLAGAIGATPRTDVERIGAEVGYWIGAEFWGRGIASRALLAFGADLFATRPELERLFALPFTNNRGSVRVLEKAGYTREGRLRRSVRKNGVVLDQWMYALLRDSKRRRTRSAT